MHQAEKDREKELLYVGGQSITYGSLMESTVSISKSLHALNVGENQKVGLIIPNSIRWYEVFWSAVRIGAQPVPMDPQSGEWELERLLDLADIEVCFISKKYTINPILKNVQVVLEKCPKLKKVVVVDAEDELVTPFISFNAFLKLGESEEVPAAITLPEEETIMSLACTSGSTGNPKVLSVPAKGFYEAIVDMSDYLGFTGEDKMLIGMPLYHQGGFGMGLQTVVKGGTVIYEPQFNPHTFLELIQEKEVTIIQLTATLAKILLSTPGVLEYDFSRIKCCYFAGEVLPREIAEVFAKQLNIRVINVIGSSETATMTVWDSDTDYEVDPSDFKALPFTQVSVIDEKGEEVPLNGIGELRICTTAVIVNYYKNHRESEAKIHTQEGRRWFHTGDLVQRLPNERVRFVGRAKRIIKRGANLVHAEEVEAFLLAHPKIQAVAVKGEENELIGQQIVAYIQLVEGESLSRGDIAKFCKGKISSYKVPDQVILTDEIPHDIGKVQHKYLRVKG